MKMEIDDMGKYVHRFFSPMRPVQVQQCPHIIAFDTEDNGQGAPNNFLCAVFYDGKKQYRFTDREKARRFMFKSYDDPVIFFAHNLLYDIMNLDFPENSIKLIPLKSRLIGGTYKNKCIARFMDTGNFFVGASINQLGEAMGFPKIDFDVKRLKDKKLEDLDEDTREEMLTYCGRDTEICWRTAKYLFDLTTNLKTRFKSFTAASLAMRIFRTNFMKGEWQKRKMFINDVERLAYYGGRTEVFDYREHPEIYYEDIKSSYPTAMRYRTFPDPTEYSMVKDRPWKDVRDMEGVSLVTVEVPKMHIPPLPYRRAEDGKLLFPYGEWTAAYTHPEIRMAEKHGVRVKRCIESIVYPNISNPFKEYIDHFYSKKDTTEGIERQFNKLMLNGLSGKFGEKREATIRGTLDTIEVCTCHDKSRNRKNVCLVCDRPQIEGSDMVVYENGWVSMSGGRMKDPQHAFPVLIAYICAYGRIKLFEDRLAHGKALYCDTDSHISVEPIDVNLGEELGDWEREEFIDFQAFAPKFYRKRRTDGSTVEIKLKGVSRDHTVVYVCPGCEMEHDDMTICCGQLTREDKRYKFERPVKLGEALRRKLPPNRWSEVLKKISLMDDKRVRHDDGQSSPIEVHESFTPNGFLHMIRIRERQQSYIPKHDAILDALIRELPAEPQAIASLFDIN